VIIIMTDRSEHADDGAIPHFSKIKSIWSSGVPQKIRDKISMHGHASEKYVCPPVDYSEHGGRIFTNDRVAGFFGDANPAALSWGQES
jgi:hypothetical protein